MEGVLNRRGVLGPGDGSVGLEGLTGAAGSQAARAGGNRSMLGPRQQVCGDLRLRGHLALGGRPQAPSHPPSLEGPRRSQVTTKAEPWGTRLGWLPALALSLLRA